jgi:hypothetical protein
MSDLASQLERRRDAAARLPPLPCGHRDPIICLARHPRRHRRPAPVAVISLSASLAALRRAWITADDDDRAVLAALADYLREVAA